MTKIFVFIIGLVFSNFALAAENPNLYFRTTAKEFSPGSTFTVGVFVDADKPINAFEIQIGYSVQTLELMDFNTNDSIVDFWRRDPEILEEGIIRIQGGLTKGFIGRAGELIKLNFRAKLDGSAQWSFRSANIYYADGFGTLATIESSPMILPIDLNAAKVSLFNEDERKPTILAAGVTRNPVDNSRMAVFNATDKESGLKGIYIRSREWFFWENWHKATNPVRLAAGVWSFELKAEDNGGNVSKKTVYVGDAIILKLIYLILFLFSALIIYVSTSRRRRKLL